LLVFDERTVPSLVVIEQLRRLTRNRLDACTEPTSDCEMASPSSTMDCDVALGAAAPDA